MHIKPALLPCLLIILAAIFSQSCAVSSDEDDDPTPKSVLRGRYKGTATNKANNADKKELSMDLTSSDNPVAGTYTLVGGSVNAAGTISGTILGAILNLSLKPDASGTTYAFSGSANTENTTLTGTIKGVESATTVTYDVVLNK
jgi:hypothetical protein